MNRFSQFQISVFLAICPTLAPANTKSPEISVRMVKPKYLLNEPIGIVIEISNPTDEKIILERETGSKFANTFDGSLSIKAKNETSGLRPFPPATIWGLTHFYSAEIGPKASVRFVTYLQHRLLLIPAGSHS